MTLLGDAAHLTAPNGDGANLAMYDGAELARAIAHIPMPSRLLSAYEQAMFSRSARSASDGALQILSGDNPAQRLIELFGQEAQQS